MKYKNAALPVRLEIHSLEAVGTETSFVSVGEEGSQSVSKKVKMPPHAWESACVNRVSPCVLAQGHEAEGHFQKGCKLGKGRHRAAGV